MTQPTLVAYGQSNWSDTTTTGSVETTTSFTWVSGDVFHVVGATEDNSVTLATPTTTGGNLTFASVTNLGTTNTTNVYYWRGTATGSGSGTIKSTQGGAAGTKGLGISGFQYRDTSGQGTPVTATGSAALTLSVTLAHDNSHVVFVGADWNAAGDVVVNPTPSLNGTQRVAVDISTQVDFFLDSWGDQGTAATTSYGITNHTGTVKMTMLAVEIFGVTSNGVALAATEAADVAAVSITAQTGTSLAATEAADSALFNVSGATVATSLAATEAADTAAVAITAKTGTSLAATEAADTAALTASAQTRTTLAATEGADTAAVSISAKTAVSLAATEATDIAAVAATAKTGLSLATTEAADTAAFAIQATTVGIIAVDLAASEATDVAAFNLAYWKPAPINSDTWTPTLPGADSWTPQVLGPSPFGVTAATATTWTRQTPNSVPWSTVNG